MTLPVFLGDDAIPALAQLQAGDSFTLGGHEGRHAVKVKRLSPGEGVDVVDGRGLRVRGTVTEASGSTMTVEVGEVIAESFPTTRLTLIQALAKGGRDEQAIEMATEIGVDQVIAWQAGRSIVKWAGPKAVKALGKWHSMVLAAAKQSRRAFIPSVEGPFDSQALTAWIAKVSSRGGVVFIAHEEGKRSLAAELASRGWMGARVQVARDSAEQGNGGEVEASAFPEEVAVVVGPEGGISPDELAAFSQAGACVVLLGPYVMRSSSAGSAALTLISAAMGRW